MCCPPGAACCCACWKQRHVPESRSEDRWVLFSASYTLGCLPGGVSWCLHHEHPRLILLKITLWGSNIQLYFWKCWPRSVKISARGHHVQKCPSRTGACDVSCRYSRTAVVRVSFCNCTDFQKNVWLIRGEKKSSRTDISLGHLVCLPEVSLVRFKQPFNKLVR